MATLRIGILSDTHLTQPSELFDAQVKACFSEIPVILHAGDLTSSIILNALSGKEIHAVHGNMCDSSTRQTLPAVQKLTVGPFTIVLTHGYGYGYHDVEDGLYNEFGTADCIVYGHTHVPVCHRIGDVLFINPGSFCSTGRFGKPGTYAVLEIDAQLRGQIMEVPEVA